MLTAFIVLPVFLIVGGGYDVVRVTNARAELNAALESAVLAAASLSTSRSAKEVVEDYLAAQLGSDNPLSDNLEVTIEAESALNAKFVDITAASKIDAYFLKLAGVNTLRVAASTRAEQSATNVELSLVLDISSSMAGGKISNLKQASAAFVDAILNEANIDLTSLNLVPFGGSVNIGDLFDTYAVTMNAAVVNPSVPQYRIHHRVPNGAFRFRNGDRCIEMRNSDYRNGDVLSQNSRPQVPHFWKWNNFNPWCPLASSSVLLNTNNADALKKQISGMTLSDGTGMNIGALWGYKSLSPQWRGRLDGDFADRPRPFDDETLKVLVIMTDGDITEQFRPRDWKRGNTHTNQKRNLDVSRSKTPRKPNNRNQQTILSLGAPHHASHTGTAIGQFKTVCDLAEDDGIVVFTIGFQIRKNSTADRLLRYCASDPSKYYFVEGLDIEAAFETIAASVNALRITG